MLTLITLGGLSVGRDGTPVDASRIRKPLALLSVVATSGEAGVARDRLQTLFWPESDSDRARGGLKQAQYVIRQALGVDPFRTSGFALSLDPAVMVCDAAQFETHVKEGEFEQAVALYGGPFLDGVYLKDVPDFEQWVDAERARLSGLYARALEQLAVAATKRGDHPAASAWWRRRAGLDRLDGRVARKYLEALAAEGDREGARRHARIHAELVRAELGEEPDASLVAFAEALPTSRPDPAKDIAQESAVVAAAVRSSVVAAANITLAPSPTPPWQRRRLAGVITTMASLLLVAGFLAQRCAAGSAAQNTAEGTSVAPSSREVLAPGVASAATRAMGAPDPPRNIGRVLVTPLSNESPDTSATTFGRLAADWMATGLAQTGMVDVVDAQTLAGMAQLRAPRGDPSGMADSELRPLAAATQAKTVVVGRYYTTRDSLVVQVMVEDPADGQVLRTLPRLAVRAGDYNKALALLRDKIAGAFATLVDPRIESLLDRAAHAPSLPAYRDYAQGLDCYLRNPGGYATGTSACNSAASFEAAIRADSSWSLPYVWLIYANGNVGNTATVDSILAVVRRRHEQMSELDRRTFEFFEHRRKGDLEFALASARRASALAPRSNWTYEAAQTANQLSRWRESRDLLRQLDPEHGWVRGWADHYWGLLDVDEHMLGNYRAELDLAHRVEQGTPAELNIRLSALIALGDSANVLRIIDSAIANPPSGRPSINRLSPLLNGMQNEAAAHGHSQLGRQIADRCLAESNPPEMATPEQRRAMHIHADCLYAEGRWSEAKAVLEQLLDAAPNDNRNVKNAEQVLLLVETRLGDSANAATHMTRFLSRADPATRTADSIMMLAHMAAIKGMKARTVELLRQMPNAANRYPTILHLNPDFRGMQTYPPFKALLAPQG